MVNPKAMLVTREPCVFTVVETTGAPAIGAIAHQVERKVIMVPWMMIQTRARARDERPRGIVRHQKA
jgi:hypothetical protein